MDTKPKITQKKELTEKPILGGGKVLVMEEDEPLRYLLSQMLEILGYESELARDSDETIELYKQAMASGEAFDGVILDLTVDAGIGGEETIKKLLEIDPDVKAVISSGYSNDPVMTDFRKYGFAAALAKPFTKKALKDSLSEIEMADRADHMKFDIYHARIL